MEAEVAQSYEVHIAPFDGPMDLLLYLVQKNELDPKDISLAQIADQYAAWISKVAMADLSEAGEFLVMAARLMALKVRELLPKDQQSDVDMLEFDQDREKLIQQMLEYQRFKEVASHLQGLEGEQVGAFYRGRMERSRSDGETLADAGIWQLFKAFKKSLQDQTRNKPTHTIELDDVTIEDRQQHIVNYLHRNGRGLFEEVLGRDTRPLVMVVTFMALMEMVKTEDIILRQSETHGALWVYRRKNNQNFAEEMAQDSFLSSTDVQLQQGVVEAVRLRNAELAAQTTVSLDAIMREVQRRVASGQAVEERDLLAMLEGTLATWEEEPLNGESVAVEAMAQEMVPVDITVALNTLEETIQNVDEIDIPQQSMEEDKDSN